MADTAVRARPPAQVDEHHPAPAEPVGQAGEGQAAEGGEAQNGEADAETGPGQAGLLGDRGATVGDVAEVLRDVAKRRHGTELSETRRRGQQRRAHHRRLAPAVEVQRRTGAAWPRTSRGQPRWRRAEPEGQIECREQDERHAGGAGDVPGPRAEDARAGSSCRGEF